MKRVFLFFAIFVFSFIPAFAEEEDDIEVSNKVIVEAMENISTESKEAVKFKVAKNVCLNNAGTFREGDIIEAEIEQVVPPKRGKRSGYMILKPVNYIKHDVKYEFEDKTLRAKVVDYRPFNIKNAALKAGVGVAGLFVKGLSPIFYLGQGIVKPEEGEGRIKSGFKNVYKNSPLALIEEGEDAEFDEGDILVLKFLSEEN